MPECSQEAPKNRQRPCLRGSDTKALNPVGKGLRLATSPNQERRGKEGGKVENLENGESGIRHRDAAQGLVATTPPSGRRIATGKKRGRKVVFPGLSLI